ncbi:MAG: hypothetical protein CM1200mP1_04030 [Candidatus Neomarinimicrobiota bacterium]|nr:MAG: hypothetical protein CM1200mP1_04030 [Candidatus Neomarinimicrobiota bacterium]
MMQSSGPSALLLTRQGVPVLAQDMNTINNGVSKGAYAVLDCDNPDLIFFGNWIGSCISNRSSNMMNDKQIRVVSMTCWEIFDKQPDDYKSSLIPSREP